MRVVSLVPSATETLISWGVEPIAVTRFCEHPELVQVGGTKDPDITAIVALEPDLVVLCDEENRIEDAVALTKHGIATHVVSIRSMHDVEPSLRSLAEAVHVAAAIDTPDVEEPPRRILAFVPIWRRPYMTLNRDTYGASMLATMGVATLFAGTDDRYPAVDLDDVEAAKPDVVIAPTEPYPFGERHREELARVAPVVFVDGQDLFWWGVRSAAAQRRLRSTINAR